MAKRLATQFYIGAFTNEEAADKIEKAVCDAEWDSKLIVVTNCAIAKKDIAGKTTVKELGNPAALQSHYAGVGGSVRGLLGGVGLLMLGPGGAKAGASKKALTKSVVAGYGAHQVEGMDKDKLAKLGSALSPGNSAIMLVFDEVIVKKSDYDEMTVYKESTDAMNESMMAKIKENLAAGNDISFHIAIDGEGVQSTRTIVGDRAINVKEIVLSQDAFATEELNATIGGHAEMKAAVVTKKGVATARALLTSSICAYEVAAISEDEATYEAVVIHENKALEG